jgi:hypothetical protein
MDYPPEARLQDGLFSRQQARAAGWSKGQVDRAIANGELTPLRPGILIPTLELEQRHGRERYETQLRADLLGLGDPWHAARRTAAVVHGLPLLGRPPGTSLLTRPPASATERSHSRFRRLADLPTCERAVVRGIRTTSLARTVFDLSRSESFPAAVVATDGALRYGMAPQALTAVLGRHPTWPGVRAARAVAAFADGRAESPLESLARVACLQQGLPVFEPQVEVWLEDRFLARVDGLWREHLLVFEGDGALKFTAGGVLPALLGRQEVVRDTGLDVVRADWDDVHTGQRPWAGRVRARMAGAAGRRLAPGVRLVSTRVRVQAPGDGVRYRWAA